MKQQGVSYKNLHSVFQNPRIQLTLQQINRSNNNSQHKSCQTKNKRPSDKKQSTFRSFAKTRRTYQTCNERQTFIKLKFQLQQLALSLQNSKIAFDISKVTELKQRILMNFLNSYVNQVSKQNLDKAQLLVIIWNNLFLLVQKSLEKVCQFAKKNETINLRQQINMHSRYQQILEQNMKQRDQMKQQFEKREKFMKILVTKLRQYKKSIKKLQQNLRIAADKLNQFRRGYLQIQIQCINLNMEYRNLGEQTAKDMVKRKMALTIEKSKQFKILPSKKKMRKQLKAQKIEPQSNQNRQIKQQFYEGYLANINEKPDMLPKVVGRIIQTILDNQQSQPIDFSIFNQQLIENKYLIEQTKIDKQTDMQGFYIQKSDKKIGINNQQRFQYQMVKMRGVQTNLYEKPAIQVKNQTKASQCDFKILKVSNLCIKKSFDLSFLFENIKNPSIVIRQNQNQKNFIFNKKKNSDRQLESKVFSQNNSQVSFQNVKQVKKSENFQKHNQKISQIFGQTQQITQQYPQIILVKRRIKKLASTSNNKISFINNFGLQRQRRYTKGDISDNFEQSNIKILNQNEAKNDLLCIDQNSEFFLRQSYRNEAQKFIIQGNKGTRMQKIKVRKKNQQVYQKKSLKSSVKKRQKSSRKSSNRSIQKFKRSRYQGDQQSVSKQNKKKTLQSIQNIKQEKTLHIFKNKKRELQIELNLQQFYKDISHQIRRIKTSSMQYQKNHNRLKQILKIIQNVFHNAWRQYQSERKINHILQYVYQVINSSYGIINNSFLRKKVINFVRETIQLKDQSSLIRLFLQMMELDQNNQHNIVYCQKNNEVLLRIGRKIYNNWKIPFKLSEISLNLDNIQQNIEKQLLDCQFSDMSIYYLMKNLEQTHSFDKNIQQFEILLRINKYFNEKQRIIAHSYEPIFNFLAQNQQLYVPKQFFNFLIEIHFFTPQQNASLRKKYSTFCQQLSIGDYLDRSLFSYFCSQCQILDFSRLFYRVLCIFQLKQNQEMFKKISIKRMRAIESLNMPKNILESIYKNCERLNQNNAFFHAMIKKNLLIILFLKIQQIQANKFIKHLIGENLNYLGDLAENQIL